MVWAECAVITSLAEEDTWQLKEICQGCLGARRIEPGPDWLV